MRCPFCQALVENEFDPCCRERSNMEFLPVDGKMDIDIRDQLPKDQYILVYDGTCFIGSFGELIDKLDEVVDTGAEIQVLRKFVTKNLWIDRELQRQCRALGVV